MGVKMPKRDADHDEHDEHQRGDGLEAGAPHLACRGAWLGAAVVPLLADPPVDGRHGQRDQNAGNEAG